MCFSMGREGQGECGDRGRDLDELDDVHDDAMTRDRITETSRKTTKRKR